MEDELTISNKEWIQRFNDQEEKINKLEESLHEMHRTIERLEKANRQLEEDNRQLKEANRQLKEDNRQLKEANRQLKEDNRQLKETICQLTGTIQESNESNEIAQIDEDGEYSYVEPISNENVPEIEDYHADRGQKRIRSIHDAKNEIKKIARVQ